MLELIKTKLSLERVALALVASFACLSCGPSDAELEATRIAAERAAAREWFSAVAQPLYERRSPGSLEDVLAREASLMAPSVEHGDAQVFGEHLETRKHSADLALLELRSIGQRRLAATLEVIVPGAGDAALGALEFVLDKWVSKTLAYLTGLVQVGKTVVEVFSKAIDVLREEDRTYAMLRGVETSCVGAPSDSDANRALSKLVDTLRPPSARLPLNVAFRRTPLDATRLSLNESLLIAYAHLSESASLDVDTLWQIVSSVLKADSLTEVLVALKPVFMDKVVKHVLFALHGDGSVLEDTPAARLGDREPLKGFDVLELRKTRAMALNSVCLRVRLKRLDSEVVVYAFANDWLDAAPRHLFLPSTDALMSASITVHADEGTNDVHLAGLGKSSEQYERALGEARVALSNCDLGAARGPVKLLERLAEQRTELSDRLDSLEVQSREASVMLRRLEPCESDLAIAIVAADAFLERVGPSPCVQLLRDRLARAEAELVAAQAIEDLASRTTQLPLRHARAKELGAVDLELDRALAQMERVCPQSHKLASSIERALVERLAQAQVDGLAHDQLRADLVAVDRWLGSGAGEELQSAASEFVARMAARWRAELANAGSFEQVLSSLRAMGSVSAPRLEFAPNPSEPCVEAAVAALSRFAPRLELLEPPLFDWLSVLDCGLALVADREFAGAVAAVVEPSVEAFVQGTNESKTWSSRTGAWAKLGVARRRCEPDAAAQRLLRAVEHVRASIESQAHESSNLLQAVALRDGLRRFARDFPADSFLDLPEPGATVAWAQALSARIHSEVEQLVLAKFRALESAIKARSVSNARREADEIFAAFPDADPASLHAKSLLADCYRAEGDMKDLTSAIQLAGQAVLEVARARALNEPERGQLKSEAHWVRGMSRAARAAKFLAQHEAAKRSGNRDAARSAFGSFETDYAGAADDLAALPTQALERSTGRNTIYERANRRAELHSLLANLGQRRDSARR